MRKLLLGFLVLITFTAFAQNTHTIDFEPAGVGADWEWTIGEQAPGFTIMNNPVSGGINTSATVVEFIAHATDNNWALCHTTGDGQFTFDAVNSTIKIMVYKPTISNVGIKFEGPSGQHEINISNTLTNEWEEITFDFSGQIGNTYSKIVIIPDNIPWLNNGFDRTEDVTLYFDNIQLPDGEFVTDPAPTTQPMPQPSAATENVISIFSDVYPNLATTWHPGWGQATEYSNEVIEGTDPPDNVSKLKNFGYEGILFPSTDVTSMDYVHFDVWSFDETSIKFFLLAGTEPMVQKDLTAESWNSFDIPLSEFVGGNLATVSGMKLESGSWSWPVGTSLVFVDNIYFWKEQALADDATLSNLMVDGTTIEGFISDVFNYNVELPFGTVDVPVLTATTNNPEASYMVNDAASLPGTSELIVTAQDEQTQQSYFVNFTIGEEPGGSEYCQTEVSHFNIPGEVPSAILLTITNVDAGSMLVEIESADADPVDLLIVTNGSSSAISDEDFSIPGKISRTLTWGTTPPDDVMMNILWSKDSFDGNWMLGQSDITVPFEAGCTFEGPAMVTFKVDMSQYAGEFTNAYVSGSFNGWLGEANQLLDPDMDNIYQTTLEIEDGEYEYKFTLDSWAVQEEFTGDEPCVVTIGGYNNRLLVVDGSETLPAVCWNSCEACPEILYDVTFSVDMNEYTGTFDNVYVSGSFNGWSGDANMMLDPEVDGVYELTLPIAEGTYAYKFTLDNWAQQEGFNGSEPCVADNNGNFDRLLEVSDNTVMPLVCWNSCYACGEGPQPKDVTFKVDLSQYNYGFGNAYVSGSFNGWCGECDLLTDDDMDGVYEGTLSLMAGSYEYKFTMDDWASQEQFAGGEECTVTAGGFTNRLLLIEEEDEEVVLDIVCWSSCTICPDYQAGWGGISSNVMPGTKIMLEELFAPIADDMVILIGQTGVYWPLQSINTIGEWDTYQGYKVKFANGVNFEFSGAPLTNRTVTFEPGLYFVPVLSEESANVSDVIMQHSGIEFMFDMTNNEVYWPEGGIIPGVQGALETLEPGYAYIARFTETTTIDFSAEKGKSNAKPSHYNKPVNTTSWNNVSATGSQHIISVNTSQLESADFIGVFDADGTCTGMAQYEGSETVLPLLVFGDDFTTSPKDGMAENESMTFKIFRNGQALEVTPTYDQSLNNHNGLFVENGLSIIKGFKTGATSIKDQEASSFSIYPNPNNGRFTLVSGSDDAYNFVVVNMQGQQILTSEISGTASIDLSDQPKGVYFIRLSNTTSTSIEKLIIE